MSGYSCPFWAEWLSHSYAPTSSSLSSASYHPLGHVSLGFRLSRSRGIVKFRALVRTGERERADADDERLGLDEVVSRVGVKGLAETRRGLSLEGGNGVVGELGFDGKWPPWKDLLYKYKLIGATSLAFVFVAWIRQVNLSVAIIPMSHQFGWNSSVAGLVQSSFFWGYALNQLPGGWLAKIFGGRKVLEIGVLAWSLSTALVPVLAGFMLRLVFSRFLVRIEEGVSPSAANVLIARHAMHFPLCSICALCTSLYNDEKR